MLFVVCIWFVVELVEAEFKLAVEVFAGAFGLLLLNTSVGLMTRTALLNS